MSAVDRTRADAPRVLAIADVEQSYVAAWRVHAPLAALKRAGRVADYTVTDATLVGLPRRGAYDVVWLQRAADDKLTQRLIDLRPGGFLFDADDHLLCRPAYIHAEEFPAASTVTEALEAARVVTVTSRRLGGLLADRAVSSPSVVGLSSDLEAKTVVCPNAADFAGTLPRRPAQPQVLLLTQGHRLALGVSAEPVLTAVADFAAAHALPICYFGQPLESLSPLAARLLRGVVRAGEMPLERYQGLLAALPPMLAVAPLETAGDPATVEFVAGKSDVKMLEYGGWGHPGVYSDAPPYAESDLACGALAANTYEAWTDALERMWSDGWRVVAAEQEDVRRRRDISVVAADSWARALDAARLDVPLDCREVARAADRFSAAVRSVRARAAWRLSH